MDLVHFANVTAFRVRDNFACGLNRNKIFALIVFVALVKVKDGQKSLIFTPGRPLPLPCFPWPFFLLSGKALR